MVDGAGMSEELGACLVDAVDQLVVPRVDGIVQVRYPFVASPLAEEPSVDLEPVIGRGLDALFPAGEVRDWEALQAAPEQVVPQ